MSIKEDKKKLADLMKDVVSLSESIVKKEKEDKETEESDFIDTFQGMETNLSVLDSHNISHKEKLSDALEEFDLAKALGRFDDAKEEKENMVEMTEFALAILKLTKKIALA